MKKKATLNQKAIERGLKRAKQMICAAVEKQMQEMSVRMVADAVDDYVSHRGHQLTGNILGGMGAAVYGEKSRNIFMSGEYVTSKMVEPGPVDIPFYDKNSKELVKWVKEYNYQKRRMLFQPTENTYASILAWDFLSTAPQSSKYLRFVMVSAAPYSEYLLKVGGFDVLKSVNNNFAKYIKDMIVKPLRSK